MSPKPRLLFFENNPAYFLSHRLALAKAAEKMGFEVHVAAMPGQAVQAIETAGFVFHIMPLKRSGMNPFTEFRTLMRIRRLYCELRPDLVYQITGKPVIYGTLAARMAKIRYSVSVVSGLGYLAMQTGIRGRVLRYFIFGLYRFSLRHPSQKVIFHNGDDRRLFVDKGILKAGDTVVIPGSGVDMDHFTPQTETAGVPVVLFPARLLRDKGVNEFFAAATLLQSRGVRARFLLVGGTDPGNPSAISEAQVRQWNAEGNVEYLGHVADMRTIFAQCHVVCLPSYREGLPKALIEAAACGRPVVTTDVPGCRDVVVNGETGLLVAPRDSTALAAALRRLIEDNDLRRRMGQAGRRYVETQFSTGQIIIRTTAILAALMESTGFQRGG
ncbi:MAG: glycosyltransferase family 4 protein [Gammaproteobacteria bacterium]